MAFNIGTACKISPKWPDETTAIPFPGPRRPNQQRPAKSIKMYRQRSILRQLSLFFEFLGILCEKIILAPELPDTWRDIVRQ